MSVRFGNRLESAVDLNPTNPVLWPDQGWLLVLFGEVDKAASTSRPLVAKDAEPTPD
ncbi:MAG TPA: hypothetical protein VNH11_03005 [Pirellulales bacterium]|nr:hypothetical protein [Pirellulales bacterium]